MTTELTVAISEILDRQQIVNGAFPTAVPGLRLIRTFGRVPPRHMIYRPSLCVVAQGAKQMLVGDRMMTYGAMQSLVITAEVPVLGTIVEASAEKPFVGASLDLNPEIILDVLARLEEAPDGAGKALGLVVENVDAQVSASILRLLDLISRPHAIDILYPAIMREIAYWLLTGPVGRNVARMVLPDRQPVRIAKAIAYIRENFNAAITIADLASIAGMSPSTFHNHFKTLTAMSPLQYQKHLRLLEARRLMVSDGENAGAAALSVGYESVSHFSREFARMFGASPGRAAKRAIAASDRHVSSNDGAAPIALAS